MMIIWPTLVNADPDLNFYNSLNQYAVRCNYDQESTFNSDMEAYPCAHDVLSMLLSIVMLWNDGARRAMPLECSGFWMSPQAGLQVRYGFYIAGEPPNATRDLYVIMVELCAEYSQ